MVEMEERSRTVGVQEERDLKKFLKFLSLKVCMLALPVVVFWFCHSSIPTCRSTCITSCLSLVLFLILEDMKKKDNRYLIFYLGKSLCNFIPRHQSQFRLE